MRTIILLGVILVLAAALRLVDLRQCPPGSTDDESLEIWNAYCLLHTGQDLHGTSFPIFYTRGFGDNVPAVFMYLLAPFQALLGLSVWSARVATAVLGVIAVLLIYLIGKSLFGRTAGLLASAMLATNPWHVFLSRHAHQANPFFLFVAIAALLWANLPFQDIQNRPARPIRAGLAGAVVGLACYGYGYHRVFLPVFLFLAVLATWRGWWGLLRTRKGALSVIAMVLGVVVTLGPLAWRHVTDFSNIYKRAGSQQLWKPSDPLGENIQKVWSRYLPHFGLDFLFVKGEGKPLSHARDLPDLGQFDWYMLPLMILGLAAVLLKIKSYAARFLLVWVILYPVADLLYVHDGVNMLRSVPGIPALILLAAFGAVSAGTWLRRLNRRAFLGAACAAGVGMAACNVYFVERFFFEYDRRPEYHQAFRNELVEAFEWLRPRLNDVDAVFCSPYGWGGAPQVYAISLVALQYDPHQWFREPREFKYDYIGIYDICLGYGKIHFMYEPFWRAAFEELRQNGRRDRVVFIVPPGTVPFAPVKEVRRPNGEVVLWICQVDL